MSFAKQFSDYVALARERAAERASRPLYVFLADGEREEGRLSFAELDTRARAIAAELQRRGARPGQRALLLFAPGLEFIAAFFGCLYAGVVALPTYPPHPRRRSARRRSSDLRLEAVARDATPRWILTTSALGARSDDWRAAAPELEEAGVLLVEEARDAAGWQPGQPRSEDLAFLQYTSGSTATPKGVRVSHGNLLHNGEMMRRAFGLSEDSVIVGWLPPYHDMGLIGNILEPLYLGATCYLMSPPSFLQQPLRWLRAVSRYRATTSGGPDFAYDLCARRARPEDLEELDLSSWTVAFNGSEPVRKETLERFAATFEPCGFERRALYPCYGLAEATLFVAGGDHAAEPVTAAVSAAGLSAGEVREAADGAADHRELVSSGRAWLGQQVITVDVATGEPCNAAEVGEIWVSGPSVADGYWHRGGETSGEEMSGLFGARLPGAGAAVGFLRTGDLGFLRDGELFVTGRLKDLIILRGRNHYPQDLELTVERSHDALRPGCGAAFAVDVAGEERLVVVHEVVRRAGADPGEVASAARRAVAGSHGVAISDFVLLRTGTLPKTTSGKIQRYACRQAYLDGSLAEVGRSPLAEDEPAEGSEAFDRSALAHLDPASARTLIEESVRRRVAEALRVPVDRLEAETPLADLGLDSLAAMEIQGRLAGELAVDLPLELFLEGARLDEIVEEAAVRVLATAGREDSVPMPAGGEGGELSWGQRALWFLDRLAPENAAYNIAAAARVEAGLDVAVLERALRELTRRHGALRTTFHITGGEPSRRVGGDPSVEVVALDATGWDETELGARLEREAYRPFDLSAGPLLRTVVFRRGEAGDVVLLAVHHVVADFWSLAILARELGELYRAEIGGSDPVLAPVPGDYGAYVSWQREFLAGPRGDASWNFWRRRLAGLPSALELATDRPRPPVQSYAGAARQTSLGEELSAAVHGLAGRSQTTLFTLLLAAFQALLHRYTGQEDLAVGSPVAGRGRPELAGVVGYFTGPVVLRAELSGSAPFTSLLEQTGGRVLEALAHQHFPFPLLAERLQPARDASRSPLFQVMYVHQRSPDPDLPELGAFALGRAGVRLRLADLTLESLALPERSAPFDLTLKTAEVGEELVAALQYNVDLFDAGTVDRLLDHWKRLLAGVAGHPDQAVAELPLLSGAERSQILDSWGSGGELAVPEVCLHEFFERRAAADPEAEALVTVEDGEVLRLSYGELDRRANRLARVLARRGVGPETQVGVRLERSADLVVSLLAVLKAGGAYVPLDPAYPRERVAYMLETSGAVLLLTRGAKDGGGGAGVPCLDPADPAIAGEPSLPPRTSARAGHLAYVIYTSGSTGRPKGVAIEHRAAVHLVCWAREIFTGEELAGVLASTSICFDLSIFELFVPLASGGKVILAENALALAGHPAAEEVRLINTVPSAMTELAAGELPPSLVTVNLAGEPLSPRLVAAVGRHQHVERLYNLYGPSEDTTYSTWARFDLREGEPERVTIGRPIAGTRAAVLDRFLRPVPAGVVGELLLGGAGLARGYAGRGAATAERFVPAPEADEPGSRLYRTGDLVRYLSSGELEYLGRGDHQVKIRGFRIEPGEIEAVLGHQAEVREAAVVVRDDLPGGRGLAAYVSPAGAGAEPEALERRLRVVLERRLPGYMRPAVLEILDRVPHTPNGKIDRRALGGRPLPAVAPGSSEQPGTPAEEILTGTFGDLLGLEGVGVEDDFFVLGGHSLLAVRLASRIRRDFGVEVPLAEIFQAPTVAGLARRIHGRSGTRPAAITPSAEPGPAPLSSGQKRMWFATRMHPESPAYNMPIALELEGELHAPALAAALGEIVRRHDSLRTRVEIARGAPVQVVDAAERSAGWLPQVDLAGLPAVPREAELQRLLTAEARRPFDLASGPPLRTRWVRLGEGRHVLAAVVHHLIADGWSLEVLGRELSTLYGALREGEPAPLASLPIQYADFAVWQTGWLAGGEGDRELDYWREQLAGAPTVLELSTDRPRPAVLSLLGAQRRLEIDGRLLREVEALARRLGLTGFMVLTAAFGLLLARRAGQAEVLVGTPTAARERPELEGLIGFLVNTLVLRLDPSGRGTDPTIEDYLGRVREVALGAYAHRDLPFDRLVDELDPATDLSRSPLFQAMILLEESPLAALDLPGLAVRRLDVHTGTAKFDLTLRLERGEERWLAVAEYSTELFDGTMIDRMLRAYVRTLSFFAGSGPGERLAAWQDLSAHERHQLLVETDASRGRGGSAETLSTLFAARVRRSPDAVALGLGDRQLSFAEVARRSRALARRLRAAGVSTDSVVGLFLPRSIEQLIALLAILEAGGAYTPLDPEQPPRRLEMIAEEAGLAAVITLEGLRERAPVPAGSAVLCLDGEPEPVEESEAGSELVPGPSSPDALAYVLYTSGSTGRPKGVMVRHRSAVNLVDALEQAVYDGSPEGSRVALNAVLTFDASVKQWVQLLNGRRLELIPEAVRLEARKLGPDLARRRVEACDVTPGQLQALVDAGQPLPPRLLIGGEDFPQTLWRRLAEVPGVRAFNVYGPTECTVDTTVAGVSAGAPRLGRPVAGARLRVLDRSFRPVPLGVEGQLWIGGAGLARGYFGRPGRTAAVFVPDPWSRRPGARLYGSGDVVRFRGDGSLAFAGRTDHQVKIRGFRVELGEIEAAIVECRGIGEAVVVVDESSAGSRLVAYAGCGDHEVPDLEEALRAHLAERLPKYMMPPVLVLLQALPRNRHGKVDREALPAPEGPHSAGGEDAAPRNPLEEVLAGMMAEVLGRDAVGIHDDFFELGGHSLLAAELVAMIQETFQIEFPLLHLFEAATVADLAEFLNEDPDLGEQMRAIAPLLHELVEMPEEVTG